MRHVRSDRAKLSLEEFEVARLGAQVEFPKFIVARNLVLSGQFHRS